MNEAKYYEKFWIHLAAAENVTDVLNKIGVKGILEQFEIYLLEQLENESKKS